MSKNEKQVDVAVVGGGIGGLAAALMLARAGRSVTLLEKAPDLGGRGVTHVEGGYSFNLGPHALYRGGHAMRILRTLGVEPAGGAPSPSGGFAVRGGALHTLPGGLLSLLTTDLLGVAGKIGIARALATLPRLDASGFDGITWESWARDHVSDAVARELLSALIRLSTYANAPSMLSAGAAIHQLQMALADNVLYLDGGWQTMVDSLRDLARQAGVEMRCSARVKAVVAGEQSTTVEFADGALSAGAVVLALPPKAAAAVVEGAGAESLRDWARSLTPVRAACLDVGLATLPRSRNLFALGVDAPLYLSVHTAAARLSDQGQAVVHVAKYLAAGEESDPAAIETELEELLELVQPGWRDLLEQRRFLPDMTVAHAVVEARGGGLPGRPGPEVPGTRSLFVVGDWVGPRGMLVDASLASAELAVQRLVELHPSVRDAA